MKGIIATKERKQLLLHMKKVLGDKSDEGGDTSKKNDNVGNSVEAQRDPLPKGGRPGKERNLKSRGS